MKVIIIGGGASGLFAAITAREEGYDVTLLEKNKKIGEKLLLTGNGRANVSNESLSVEHFYGDKEFVNSVLCQFDLEDLKKHFLEMGLIITSNNGYYYPNSFQAQSLVNVLRNYASKIGVKIKTDNEVKAITKDEKFGVDCGYVYQADKVIIATGGCSYSSTGSTGDGYEWAKSLGHTIVEPTPALVPINCKTALTKASGVRANVAITYNNYTENGQLQITNYGLSGIPIFNISRRVKSGDELVIDFAPDYSFDDLYIYFSELDKNGMNKIDILCSLLNTKLAAVIIDEYGDKNLKDLVYIIKNYKVSIKSKLDFDRAQVTAGGVLTSEVDSSTMQSKLIPGLYFAGEVLDIDGMCGGYNLHFAWATGHIAGQLK